MIKPILFSIILLLIHVNLVAQSSLDFDAKKVTDLLYQFAKDDTPGMAVGIVSDGQIVYEKYLGYANMEHQVKVNERTRFNIASNAKQFTALCILILVEEGKLSLEDDIRTYLPNLYKDIEEPITVSQLITHTSGVRDYCNLLALTSKTWWKQFIDNGDAMDLILGQTDLNFAPGSEFMYSNSNYIIMTEIIKQVSGMEFSAYAKDLFVKLGMNSTEFLSNYMAIVPNKARPYGNWGSWSEEPIITEVHGDGALYTNLGDQLSWEQIVQVNDGSILVKESIEESQRPLASSIDNSYGYGLEFGRYGGLDFTFHNGSTAAYNATFLRFPSKKVSIVIMSNNRSVPTNYLAQLIADYILKLPSDSAPYPFMPDVVEAVKDKQVLLGVYQSQVDESIIKVVEREGDLYREIYRGEAVKLIQEDGGQFKYEQRSSRINFTNIGKENQGFTFYLAGLKPEPYRKITSSDLADFDRKEIRGIFYNPETKTEITIDFVDGDTYSISKNGRVRDAQLILADHLRMGSYLIKVIRNDQYKVVGLNVRNDRIKNVMFTKKRASS